MLELVKIVLIILFYGTNIHLKINYLNKNYSKKLFMIGIR